MKTKQKILALTLLFSTMVLFTGPTASAVTCGSDTLQPGQNCCGGVVTSIISCTQTRSCADGPDDPWEGVNPNSNDYTKGPAKKYSDKYKHKYGKCKSGHTPVRGADKSGIWGLLLIVLNIMTTGVGVVAIGGVVYGSIMYTTAGGNPEQVKKAKTIIGNVILGIIGFALIYSFLNYLIPGGLFS